MAEYIEREALLKHMVNCSRSEVPVRFHYGAWKDMCINGEEVEAWVMSCHTADVVEVVRCKDCVCRSGSSSVVHHCTLSGIPVDGDDFCSYGERKDADDRP